MTKDADGYLVLKITPKSYLRGGPMTKDTDGHLVSKIMLSPTYGADKRPMIPTDT